MCLFKLSAEAVPGDRPTDLLNNSDPVQVWRLLEGFVGLGFCTAHFTLYNCVTPKQNKNSLLSIFFSWRKSHLPACPVAGYR